MSNNPIPFNPDTMTVSQLKECAETLRTLFLIIERDYASADEMMVGHLTQVRDQMLKKWGAAK